MPERRSHARSRVLKGAKLIVGTSSVLDCIVRDLTNEGARVAIPNAVTLPDVVDLTFDGGRTLRSCEIAWRALHETGLRFLKTKPRRLTRQRTLGPRGC